MFTPHKPAKPGFEVAVAGEAATKGGGASAAPEEPIEKLLASATVEKGETAAKKCAACHTFGKGEPNRVGPNLYGVVGRERGSHAGLQLFGRHEGQARQVDRRGPQRLPAQSEGASFPAPR